MKPNAFYFADNDDPKILLELILSL